MKPEKADVALIRCESYEAEKLDKTIETCAEIASLPDLQGKTILIKPNVLNASPASKAVTTNPAFVEAVIQFAKSRGAKEILVGDSPGWQPVMLAAKTSGIYDAVQQSGGTWADFREVSPHPVKEGKKLKNIPLTSLVEEVDLVINLPKLKNHGLMTYTGAIKNLKTFLDLSLGQQRVRCIFNTPRLSILARCLWIWLYLFLIALLLWMRSSQWMGKALDLEHPTRLALSWHLGVLQS